MLCIVLECGPPIAGSRGLDIPEPIGKGSGMTDLKTVCLFLFLPKGSSEAYYGF